MRSVAKCLTVALGAMAVLGAAAGPVLAHDGDRWDDHGWKHGRHFVPPGHVYYVERPVVVERPVIVAPPPRVYYPEPMYYGPPQPPSINFNIPLR